jgi:hypothetical protein
VKDATQAIVRTSVAWNVEPEEGWMVELAPRIPTCDATRELGVAHFVVDGTIRKGEHGGIRVERPQRLSHDDECIANATLGSGSPDPCLSEDLPRSRGQVIDGWILWQGSACQLSAPSTFGRNRDMSGHCCIRTHADRT